MAQSEEDLLPLAALCQDALVVREDMVYDPKGRHLTLRMNRFCHERQSATPLRALSALQIHGIMSLSHRGLEPGGVYALLNMQITPLEAPAFRLEIHLAGSRPADIRMELEALDMLLLDLSPPHRAKSRPQHPL